MSQFASTTAPSITVAATLPSTTAPPTTTVTTATTTAATIAAAAGTLSTVHLAPQVAPGKFAEDSYTVPDGSVLRITDVIVQNPNGDRGSATFAVGDQTLLSWSLDYVAPTLATPLVSPIEVPAGTVVHFVVTCTQVGPSAAASGTCQPALLLSGRVAPSA